MEKYQSGGEKLNYIKSIESYDDIKPLNSNIDGLYYIAKDNYDTGKYRFFTIVYNKTNFTFNYKFMTDRIAQYNDTLWAYFDNYSPIIALRPINGKVYIDIWNPKSNYDTNKYINANTIYNVTVTGNNNIYKWYLDGELIYTYNSSVSLKSISMIKGWIGGDAGDFNTNYIFGDIFFADECLIDGNFTVDNTKLFMNELGPGATLESNDKIYGMK